MVSSVLAEVTVARSADVEVPMIDHVSPFIPSGSPVSRLAARSAMASTVRLVMPVTGEGATGDRKL
jgi:hypothetical protein